MKLILPEQITEEQYQAYLADWGAERIVPIASANPKGLSFEDWRAESIKRRTQVPKGFVPETLFFLTDENETKLFGAVDIRHELNDYLLQFGGHIGYGIVPSGRRRGYAKIQLALTLPIAHAMGLQKVLIPCADTNIGSAKTIENAGGVLENKVEKDGALTRRYWVSCENDFEGKGAKA